MRQTAMNGIEIKHPNIHASRLIEASDRIHELTALFEYLQSCLKWEAEQPLTEAGAERADDLQHKRLEAYDALSSLAVSVLLGTVNDAISTTAQSLAGGGGCNA